MTDSLLPGNFFTVSACRECGCKCYNCFVNSDPLVFHHQIESLKSDLSKSAERVNVLEESISSLKDEKQKLESKLKLEVNRYKERFERLQSSQKKLQSVNNQLELSILKSVHNHESQTQYLKMRLKAITEKMIITQKQGVQKEWDAQKWKADCALAVSLLRSRPPAQQLPVMVIPKEMLHRRDGLNETLQHSRTATDLHGMRNLEGNSSHEVERLMSQRGPLACGGLARLPIGPSSTTDLLTNTYDYAHSYRCLTPTPNPNDHVLVRPSDLAEILWEKLGEEKECGQGDGPTISRESCQNYSHIQNVREHSSNSAETTQQPSHTIIHI